MRCRISQAVVVLVAGLLGVAHLEAATVYVSTAGNDGNNGLTWATAKKTVQAGLNAAVSGDQVWVAAGTYVENITLKAGVALYGGFAGSEVSLTQRNWTANLTVLDGNHAGSVVNAPPGATAVTRIDGFTIRNGTGTLNGRYGGGINCLSSPTIANNTITANRATYGGGIYCSSSTATILGNRILGNTASSGGGIYCDGPCGLIANNIIADNSAITTGSYGQGGGIYCYRMAGAGIANNIVNNTVAGNCAYDGGGIYCDSSNVTIANTIVAFNSSGICTPWGTPTLSYNCLFGNAGYNYSGVTDPTGTNYNISVDPKLAQPTSANVHIQPDSPCLNAGDDGCVQAGWTDVDGQPRTQGAHVDIGADESDGTLWPAVSSFVVRVSPQGSDASDGSSWVLAKRTVQAGIDTASAYLGGQVWVAAGTYVENTTLRAEIAVYGGFAGTETDLSQRNRTANVTVLDGNQAGSVVTVAAGTTQTTRIDGFTIRNGSGTRYGDLYGGGIYCLSSPTIANNNITANTATYGGGIYCDRGAAPLIAGNKIIGNTTPYAPVIPNDPTSGRGGGIYSRGSATITNNTITNNSALGGGGGIECQSAGTTIISNNTITGNAVLGYALTNAGGEGGGIDCGQVTATIESNIIMGNTSPAAGGMGGGICFTLGTPTIRNNTVTGNSAAYFGGGIDCGQCSSGSVTNNTVTGNSAYYSGGGISSSRGSLMIANNRVAANRTSGKGGGIYCYSSADTVSNNTVTGNSGPNGGGIYCDGAGTAIVNTIVAYNSSGLCSGSGIPSLGHNCVYGNTSYNYSGLADPTGTNGNISADPVLADLSAGNLHIQPNSPCVDAGDDSAVQAGWLDMDGQPRTLGTQVDIGADESDGTLWQAGPSLVIRVSPGGDDANDGLSWAQAKRTVQAAIIAAATTGGQVWVQAGTYQECVTLLPFTHLYGGFAGGESDLAQRNWTANQTILDGNQAGSVVTVAAGTTRSTRIDGLVIRNGKAATGGGIYCNGASPTIANNTIVGNKATASGGGIVCTYSSSPTIAGNTIFGNSAKSGGGIFCYSSDPPLSNNTIYGNTASSGGGIYSSSSSPTIVNTIVAFNASGIYKLGTGTPVLRYNCVFGNTSFNYSGLTNPTGTNGNISADPRFVRLPNDGGDGWGDDPATPGVDEEANDNYGNLRLLPGSPCIDAGSNADVPADITDLNGNGNTTEPLPFDLAWASRFADDPVTVDTGAGTAPIVDIGAYEYHCGDSSGDGRVDVVDLLNLADGWGSLAGDADYNAACDFNHDGSVDVIDLLLLARNWGT
jgi:parallel beta-helix repeat protein